MAEAKYSATSQDFQEAIDALTSKRPELTAWSRDRTGPWHAKSFTVAGITRMDALSDIHTMVKQAQANGQTLSQFRREFANTFRSKGWDIRGDAVPDDKAGKKYLAWRAELIYNQSMRSAHMAGRWKQFSQMQPPPLLKYIARMDLRTRPQHAAWNGITRPVGDSFWSTHYPPCGFNCRCTVVSVEAGQPGSYRDEVDRKPFETTYRDVVSKTGEITDRVPLGIDPGFDTNVGTAWLEPEVALGRKIAALPKQLQGLAVDKTLTPAFLDALNQRWNSFFSTEKLVNKKNPASHVVGFFDSATLLGLADKVPQLKLGSTATVVFDFKTVHLTGQHKADRANSQKPELRNAKASPKQVWPEEWLADLPEHLADYEAVFWDERQAGLIVIPRGAFNDWTPYVALSNRGKAADLNWTKPNVVSLGARPEREWSETYQGKPRFTLVAGNRP